MLAKCQTAERKKCRGEGSSKLELRISNVRSRQASRFELQDSSFPPGLIPLPHTVPARCRSIPFDADDYRSVRWRLPVLRRTPNAERETLSPAHRFAEVSGLRSGSYVSFACCFATEEERS